MEPIDHRSPKSYGLKQDGHKLPLSVFLFVNTLEPFQRSVIQLIARPLPTDQNLSDAKRIIEKRRAVLTNAGWKPKEPEGDMVMQPQHYSRFPLEPTTFIRENNMSWNLGNALKYICRYPFKNGLQDLSKAIRYIALEERYLAGDQEWSK